MEMNAVEEPLPPSLVENCAIIIPNSAGGASERRQQKEDGSKMELFSLDNFARPRP